jgi:putative membrane protein
VAHAGAQTRTESEGLHLRSEGPGVDGITVARATAMTKTMRTVLGSTTLALVIAGCGGNGEPPKTPDNVPLSNANTTTPAEPAGVDGGMTMLTPPVTPAAISSSPNEVAPTERMPSDSSPISLTDDQILQITHVANQGEIEQAALALAKAKDPRVKKLARAMEKDHTAADDKGLQLGRKNHLGMSPSKTATDLESGANDNTQKLKGESNADFDKSYVDTQIKEHQEVLDTIDQKLVPNAKKDDVRAFLKEVRGAVAMHLEHAKDLQAELSK